MLLTIGIPTFVLSTIYFIVKKRANPYVKKKNNYA